MGASQRVDEEEGRGGRWRLRAEQEWGETEAARSARVAAGRERARYALDDDVAWLAARLHADKAAVHTQVHTQAVRAQQVAATPNSNMQAPK